MIEAIRSYMDDQITAFQFDEMLTEIGCETEDKTVRSVRHDLWFYYDDCKDHNVVASKQVWDFFNRALLLLASDAEIQVVRAWRSWHAGQMVAAISLACFFGLVVRTGTRWGPELFGLAIPFGVVSMVICWFNFRRRKRATTTMRAALDPFPTFKSLLSVRRKIRGFQKLTYPSIIAGRRVRSLIAARLPWLFWIPMWLLFSPIILFLQLLPEKESETTLTTPELGYPGGTLQART